LIPARAGLNAVAIPEGRNIQAGTAILNLRGFELMSKVLFLVLVISVSLFVAACGSTTETNVNANNSAGTGPVPVDPNNLPPGLSTSPVPPSGNSTPGIPDPAAANNLPKGATPTPGIPDPSELRKPFKPGATPTPGIPDPETLRKQMQRSTNVNINARPATGDDSMMMKKRPAPVNKP
jgi:hypothetical protein